MTAKTYTHGDLTVVWAQDRCIHSAKCVSGLPNVFDPNRRPWIDLSAADRATIIAQVETCPTKALSWTAAPPQSEEATTDTAPSTARAAVTATGAPHVDVTPNGPLIVRGPHQVTTADGKTSQRQGPVAYCRCGASARKPFCDGAHARINFQG